MAVFAGAVGFGDLGEGEGLVDGKPELPRFDQLAHGGQGVEGVVLAVADTGPGIPAQDRTRVVERFVRLEASRNSPGTGLGLSLVAAVAHYHGTQLVLEDNGPGLKASLAFPKAAKAMPVRPAMKSAAE